MSARVMGARRAVSALLLSLAVGAHGQRADLQFAPLGAEQGLPQTFAMAVARDSLGFVWVGTAGGLARYDGYRVDVFQPDPSTPGAIQDHGIQELLVARDGTLWAGTLLAGLARFDAATETFHHVPVGPEGGGYPYPAVQALREGPDGALWAGTPAGLDRVDPGTGERTHIQDGPAFEVLALAPADDGGAWASVLGRGLYRVAPDGALVRHPGSAVGWPVRALVVHDGRVWMGGGGGLAVYDPGSRSASRVESPALSGPVTALFVEPGRGWLWAAAPGGFVLVDMDAEAVLTVRSNAPGNALGLPSANATDVLYDRSGMFWVATAGDGVAVADFRTSPLRLYRERPGDPASLASSSVRSVATGPGAVWVGPSGQGLNRVDPETGRVARLPVPVRPAGAPAGSGQDPTFWGLDVDRGGDLWGVLPWGVARHDGTTGRALRTYVFPDSTFVTHRPAFVHRDRRGRYWVGAGRFAAFDPGAGTFRAVWPGQAPATAVHETAGGVLWVATLRGLVRYDPGSGARRVFRHDPADRQSLTSDEVIAMWAESDRVLWLGTTRGLSRFDTRTGAVRRFTTTTSALPDNFVNGVLGDGRGSVWASTNRGLARLDAATGRGAVVGDRRGLQAQEFNRGAYHRAADGTLYFGGIDGLNAFDPARLRENPYPPEVRLRRVTAGDDVVVAGPGAHGGGTLRLRPDQSDLTVEYVGLHYAAPAQNRYQYRMEGVDGGWRPVTAAREARYTNLAPGRYTLHVRAASALGVWSDDVALLSVHLPPPWWGSAWFRALALLAGLGAAVAAYRWRTATLRTQERRLRVEVAARTQDLAREQARTERQAAELARLNEQQGRLFANVSHETRTPLTLILGPVEDALAGDLPDDLRALLTSVRQNGRRLLLLVDQILDLSRMEAGQTPLRLQRADLSEVVATLAAAFEAYAERRGLDYACAVPAEPVVGGVDLALVEHVLFNLASNAVKFTEPGGAVRVSLESDGETATVRVRDAGVGIPPDQLPHIFDRFALADAGGLSSTGLGLAIVKEAVDLHGGTVGVESELGVGTTFTVRLPLSDAADGPLAAYAAGDHVLGLPDDAPAGAGQAEAPDGDDRTTVLVVEDAADVRAYVASVLAGPFRVVEAADGAEGLAAARETTPDLVVSDVSMPGMDGLELVRALRDDPDLGTVPVVLLTARAEVEDRLAGLGVGADDYLAKPFDARELRARVSGLIERRRAWRDQFTPAPLAGALVDAFPDTLSADDALRQRIDEAVHERFTDGSFSADDLARAVGLSGSQLRRRTRELYDETPSRIIRSYRLRQAALQLEKRTGTVAEVAYAVGFNSVSYFTRSFGEAFGRTPTEHADAAG